MKKVKKRQGFLIIKDYQNTTYLFNEILINILRRYHQFNSYLTTQILFEFTSNSSRYSSCLFPVKDQLKLLNNILLIKVSSSN